MIMTKIAGEAESMLLEGIVSMIQGTVRLGMEPGDAMNCLITSFIILATNFEDPEQELNTIARILTSDESKKALKFYLKGKKKYGK